MGTPNGKNGPPRQSSGAANRKAPAARKSPPVDSCKNRVTTADFVATLVREEAEYRREQLASHELLRGLELQALLQLSPQALSGAVRAKRFYALRGPGDVAVYPAFFADPSHARLSIERVCRGLGSLPGATKHFFLTSARFFLGGLTPLQALAKGKEPKVLAMAEVFEER
nr:hypothetical protein [Massilia sp. JS1662]